MPPLPTELRRLLDKKVVEARDAAEDAAAGALKALAVDRSEPFPSMSEADRQLRRMLRAQARQLGSFHEPLSESPGFELLASEIAYEQWHRMLFARFLAENGLLMHSDHGVAVTLAECAELAAAEGEPDEWMLAARYASRMLPGIFRSDDPTLNIRFAPEGRQALERILADLPAEVFAADDSLGWVYQFWQSKKKKEVNTSERKIGGADLAPVTQLFTEHYMVAFLLENSLGAWWAGKHPNSPLLKEWEYLRYAEDGTPAAGTFEGWPDTVEEVTMMDPCCGSGHFLVAGFEMLRKMREEEKGLSRRDAAEAVLADNLFGLELDGRCVQIAVFALALAAWKVGGYRELPSMNIACSGIPARGRVEEWRKLAGEDRRLADALERLFYLFKDADTLGSLIDPRRAAEADTLLGVDYEEIEPLLHEALSRYGGEDPAQRVFARAAVDVAAAAKLLAGQYTLVSTNVPYLARGKQQEVLRAFCERAFGDAKTDLATAMLSRASGLSRLGGSVCLVTPQNWFYLAAYARLRERLLAHDSIECVARLGTGAFEEIGGEVVNTVLVQYCNRAPDSQHRFPVVDVSSGDSIPRKREMLGARALSWVRQAGQRSMRGAILSLSEASADARVLGDYVRSWQGLVTGDVSQFTIRFWEVRGVADPWVPYLVAPDATREFTARSTLLKWESGRGALRQFPGAHNFNPVSALGKPGVLVAQMGNLYATLSTGEMFNDKSVPLVPIDEATVAPLWAFCSSVEFHSQVRQINKSISVGNGYFLNVPFDLARWEQVAGERYPEGLPQPHSDDPTQWLFKGDVASSESPLHVAVARLLGYSWPDQEPDELDRFSDPDGIVCLPPIGGERPAADRLLELLSDAYGDGWSHSVSEHLLAPEGAKDLEIWLRDKFFASHCKLFHNRPFIWQIWDGRKDGFSALVNYHKLDRRLLERLTYTMLQSWIDRQKHEVERGEGGAEARLAGAEELKAKLELILEGEPPYDIFVRWKALSEQPIGWDPDINDGVRLNVRPFVKAEVLRSKFNVKWNKDRGKNPDGSERLNDPHYTVAQKREAREKGRSD